MPHQTWIPRSEAIRAWHFMPEDRRLKFAPGILVTPGTILTEDRPLVLHEVGLHASQKAADAIRYGSGPVVSRCLLWGDVIESNDKLCASHREHVAMADATTVLSTYACDMADRLLFREQSCGRKPHPASWAAVAVKRRWLKGEATDQELASASDAAWYAWSRWNHPNSKSKGNSWERGAAAGTAWVAAVSARHAKIAEGVSMAYEAAAWASDAAAQAEYAAAQAEDSPNANAAYDAAKTHANETLELRLDNLLDSALADRLDPDAPKAITIGNPPSIALPSKAGVLTRTPR